jgi:serine phosphatase RsbU (regulator of sigma subunit)
LKAISSIKEENDFTNHVMNIEKGDVFYFFSDGYPDQIGGPKCKKFMRKKFRELLVENHQKPMSQQNNILATTLSDWKGNEPQIDDILVMGLTFYSDDDDMELYI